MATRTGGRVHHPAHGRSPRLARARELGCEVAYSVTLPGTASRRNMERAGFRVAYPKVLMVK